jgi:hypothetical protein
MDRIASEQTRATSVEAAEAAIEVAYRDKLY